MKTYYANVTFPSSALNFPPVRAWYRSLSRDCAINVLEEGNLMTYAVPEALFGVIEVTSLLDTFQVPYDHFHRDETNANVYTDQVRFVDGERTSTIVRRTDVVVRAYAVELLDLLEQGTLETLRERLQYTVDKVAAPDIEAIAKCWDADQLYVMYSKEQVDAGEHGAAFWSNLMGWVTIEHASVYPELDMLALPLPQEEDTSWMTLADAHALYSGTH